MCISRAVLVWLVTVAGGHAAEPAGKGGGPAGGDKVDPDALRAKLYGSWVEVSGKDAGENVPAERLNGWRFGPDGWETWELVGELSPTGSRTGARVDPAADPMHLDLRFEKSVTPGIFKFDGDDLIWVTPAKNRRYVVADSDGKVGGRPSALTSTKENGYTLRVLKRSTLYGTVPGGQPAPAGERHNEPATAGNPAARMTRAEAERKWADYWVEVKVTAGGKPGDPSWYWGRSFVPDKADGSFASWLVMGEAVLSPYPGSLKIDTSADPMRVDLVHTGRAIPGIFRFDGDDLVWVTPRGFNPPMAFGCKPMVRPADFTSTEANGHVVRVLKRTTGLYGVEPVAPKGEK